MKDLKLGDKTESLIKAILPEKVIKAVTSHDCGCAKRKQWLNNLTKPK